MASKKEVVRCVSCGTRAAYNYIGVEPVCDNIACHVYVHECILAAIEEQKEEEEGSINEPCYQFP